jgi:hypothetical protein
MDNLNTHREKALIDHFGPRAGRAVWRRLTVHYTPKHGSWLNQAEIELSLVSRQCLGRRRIAALRALQAETRAWTAGRIPMSCRVQDTLSVLADGPPSFLSMPPIRTTDT